MVERIGGQYRQNLDYAVTSPPAREEVCPQTWNSDRIHQNASFKAPKSSTYSSLAYHHRGGHLEMCPRLLRSTNHGAVSAGQVRSDRTHETHEDILLRSLIVPEGA